MARADCPLNNGVFLIEGARDQKSPLVVANCGVSKQGGSQGVLNPTKETVTVYQGTKVAHVEDLAETVVVGEIGQDTGVFAAIPDTPIDKQDLLWGIVEKAGEDLTSDQRSQLYDILLRYSDVFASSSSDPGRTGKLKYRIDTGPSAPIRQHPRRVPPARREEVSKLLKERDVIQPSASPWASPVVLVCKKDGSLRFYSPAVPRGQSKKLPWTGPYQVVKQLSEVVYRIQNTHMRRQG